MPSASQPPRPPASFPSGREPDQRLDVRGLLCPIPVQRTASRVGGLAPGTVLEVVGDDPLMRLDLATWAAREGHEVVAMEEREGVVRCRLRVGGR